MHRSPAGGAERRPVEGDITRTFAHAGASLAVAGGSRVGYRYSANFDVLHVDPALPFVAVADGMGGGRGSAVAGATAMGTLVEAVRTTGPDLGPAQLRAAVAEAQARVLKAGSEMGELTGCTLTAMIATAPPVGPAVSAVVEPDAWIVQIGDSRAYRLRAGLLELLTVDHTAAWLGAVYGWYHADSSAAAVDRYQLTRYLGHPDSPEPDLLNVSLRPGDVYCLCTDGVAEQLDYQRLARRLGTDASPVDLVRGILADTLTAGGRDNATVAIVRVEDR